MSYIMFSNVYNESENIEKMVEMVFNFSLRPSLYIIIDDGSIDDTSQKIEECINTYGVTMPMLLVQRPKKNNGDLSTIGWAYNHAFESLNLLDMDFDFMTIIDVDNEIHSEYYEKADKILKNDNQIGIVSGYHLLEPSRIPRGNAKCIRWKIIHYIKGKFWGPAPDMYLNIKALAAGYNWYIMKDEYGELKGKPGMRYTSNVGAHWAGRLWSYVGASYPSMLLRVVKRLLCRKYGIAFYKGYRNNKNWRCNDLDILTYYQNGYWCKLKKKLRIVIKIIKNKMGDK